ncbi:hypothetical protein [Pseudomonas aeruginosa]|uniref:hypothetical protein n=1 Tax=Pseudomonas aeruginosa TaxID=287 RepID=UPI0013C2DE45|nr:hypothetical protein [Pseudomonas aeruginosa]
MLTFEPPSNAALPEAAPLIAMVRGVASLVALAAVSFFPSASVIALLEAQLSGGFSAGVRDVDEPAILGE